MKNQLRQVIRVPGLISKKRAIRESALPPVQRLIQPATDITPHAVKSNLLKMRESCSDFDMSLFSCPAGYVGIEVFTPSGFQPFIDAFLAFTRVPDIVVIDSRGIDEDIDQRCMKQELLEYFQR